MNNNGHALTKKQFFDEYAPSFNFMLDADELIERAILEGFIIQTGDDEYQYPREL